jgi:hypothetical protein
MLQRVGKGATGIVAFVASLLSVVFVLWPALKPDEPAPARSARLSNVTLEPNLSFGQYLDRIDQSRKPFPRSELEQRVAFAQFDFTIEGYKDKRLPLRWQLFDVRTGDRLAQARDVYITAVANRDSGTWQIYAPLPRGGRRRLQFEIQLYDDRNAVPLSRVRTQQFPGLR